MQNKRYIVNISQNSRFVQTITALANSNNSARLKALRMLKDDNKGARGIISAIAKHCDHYGNEIPERVSNYNYSVAYVS